MMRAARKKSTGEKNRPEREPTKLIFTSTIMAEFGGKGGKESEYKIYNTYDFVIDSK